MRARKVAAGEIGAYLFDGVHNIRAGRYNRCAPQHLPKPFGRMQHHIQNFRSQRHHMPRRSRNKGKPVNTAHWHVYDAVLRQIEGIAIDGDVPVPRLQKKELMQVRVAVGRKFPIVKL